jgi:hypothetical protein
MTDLNFQIKEDMIGGPDNGSGTVKDFTGRNNKDGGEGDVVSLLFYIVVVYSTFQVQMVKQCFAHILQRRICLNPSHGSADR